MHKKILILINSNNMMKKYLNYSMLLVVLFVNYSWCQTNHENTSVVKWGKAGSTPDEYNMGGDPFSVNIDQAGFVKYIGDNPEGMGTWMTSIKPGKYLGKRVKLSVNLKSKDVEQWASMWMRVDGKEKNNSLLNANPGSFWSHGLIECGNLINVL